MNREKASVFFRTVIFPLLPMLLWGSLYPMVKLGYSGFGIDTGSVPDIIMFAALRFTVCGGVVWAVSIAKKEHVAKPVKKNLTGILIMGLFAIVLHYSLVYVGLTLTDSSKTSLLKQTGALIYICTSFLYIKDEKFSPWKIVGGILGFVGIAALSLGGGASGFSTGDLLILGASLCSVVSSAISHHLVKNNSPLAMTGISQFAGGLVLMAVSLLMGGRFPTPTLEGLLIFCYICAGSIGGYIMWCYAQRTISLSRLFIIKFAEPLFSCIFSAALLGENIFKWQYLAAFLLICGGITLGSKKSA